MPRDDLRARSLRATSVTIGAGLVFLSVPLAAQVQDDPRDILLNARQRVMNTIRQLPKYVCTQTVDRRRYEPPDPEYGTNGLRRTRSCDDTVAEARRSGWERHLSSADRLRLDVAVTQDSPTLENEMYSWAGENRFSDRDLFDFVHEGAVSTGSFASMLASIFGNPAARFSYQGDSAPDGRMLSEFDFHIPRDKSEYHYVFGETRTEQVAVSYDGAVLVDPANSDLMRLSVRTEQLPPETGACEVTQELKYTHVRLNAGDFLLPAEAKATIIHRDGTEAENRIQYSACHEFQGDATVRFDNPQPEEGSSNGVETPVPPLSLPAGLPFKVAFTDRIDAAKAAAGDAIHGRLKTAIKDRSEKVLIPEGTLVTGRIMRIQRSYHSSRTFMSDRRNARLEPAPSLVIAIRLEALDAGRGSQPFNAAFETGVHRFVKQTGPFSARVDIGSLEELHSRPKESDTGIFEFWDNDPDHAVKTIVESSWFTAAP
jgi:hypothetical protein